MLTRSKVSKYGPNRGLLLPSALKFVANAAFDVDETGDDQHRTVEFRVKAGVTFTLTDTAGVGQDGSVELCDIPSGADIAKMSLSGKLGIQLLTPFIDAPVVTIGIGSAAASGGVALATDKVDFLAAKTLPVTGTKLVGGAFTDITPALLTGKAKLYLNIRVADDVAHATTPGQILLATGANAGVIVAHIDFFK